MPTQDIHDSPPGPDGTCYRITVRNEDTGEVAAVAAWASCALDAQIDVLHTIFCTRGWHRASASCPNSLDHGWSHDYERFQSALAARYALSPTSPLTD